MIPLRGLLAACCACLFCSGLEIAEAQVPASQSSGISRIDLKVTEWFSQGETIWSHNASGLDPNLGNPSSKLRYKDTGTNVTEITGQVHLKNKFFVRGAFGYGAIGGGRLTDDDFLSAQGAATQGATVSGEHRFSRTYSDIGGDNLWYVKGDLGATVHTFQDNKGSVGAFVGLQYWRERQVATGVTQAECTTASSSSSEFRCSPVGTVKFRNQDVITNTVTWISGRAGGEVEYRVDPRVTIEARAALLLSYLNNEDVHHMRTDLAQDPSFRMTGFGVGTDADLNLRVRIWNRLYLSGGYRVWFNRVVAGDQWKLYGSDGSVSTAPLVQAQTLRHGPTVALTFSF
ncbi:MAG: hypothetical protein JSR62_10230 [Nitrospira sp.]|nr:hypothetical protein [Nitrospira sp.]